MRVKEYHKGNGLKIKSFRGKPLVKNHWYIRDVPNRYPRKLKKKLQTEYYKHIADHGYPPIKRVYLGDNL